MHQKTVLSALAEQFGEGLDGSSCLRSADNNLKLSDVSNEVHDLSNVFTGGIYDILADVFTTMRDPRNVDDAVTLHAASKYMCSLVLRAIEASPDKNATFQDVAKEMIRLANDEKSPDVAKFVDKHFKFREVIGTAPLAMHTSLDGNRQKCCGTMQHAQYR